MNYLAHAYYSGNNPELLLGNMVADFVKGRKALAALPAAVQRGVILHRAIDAFADAHPACRRAALLFRTDYRLYASPITDVVMDHYLANDPAAFSSKEALVAFSTATYRFLDQQSTWFPDKYARMFPYMKEQDWLSNYRSVMGLQRGLSGLQRKAAFMPDSQKAYEIFIANYYYLNQCWFDLAKDMATFVKTFLADSSLPLVP